MIGLNHNEDIFTSSIFLNLYSISKRYTMKIFTSAEIREIEAATIRLEPVTPAGLMERAATALFQQVKDIVAPERKINVFAGPGNNGATGLSWPGCCMRMAT